MSALCPAFIQPSTLQTSKQFYSQALYPLSLAFLQVQGQEVLKFLQGQLSCDVSLVNDKHSSLGTHCSAKGRMQSSFRIFNSIDKHYTLALPADNLQTAQTQLHKYALFSKVSLTPLSDYVAIGLHGTEASAALAAVLGELPNQDFAQIAKQDCIIICTSKQFASYEIYGSSAALEPLWQQLSQQITSYQPSQHTLLQHQLGLAFIQQATSDAFIPQMFNYQNTPAISFNKGCYTGQEIVARMHYLGANKRELYHGKLTGDAALKVGDNVSLQAAKQGCGSIVSLVKLDEDSYDALLVLTDAGAEAKQLFVEQQAVQLALYS